MGISLGSTLDPVGDFSTISNPNSPWSYGYTGTLGGTFQQFPYFSRLWWQIDAWNADPADDGSTSVLDALSISANTTNTDTAVNTSILPPGFMWLHPGHIGQYADLRWTAPADTSLNFWGFFQGLDNYPTTSDAHVLINGVSIADRNINGFGWRGSFHIGETVTAGTTIDFVVGYGSNGNYVGDPTGLKFTATPEPATGPLILLLFAGVALFGGFRAAKAL